MDSPLELLRTDHEADEGKHAWPHNHQELVHHSQQCTITLRIWSCIIRNSQKSARLLTLLNTFLNTARCSKVLFTNECNLLQYPWTEMLCFELRRIRIAWWSSNISHHMLWAGMTATHLTGPCFFNGPVKAASYAKMLEAQWIPQLRDRGLMKTQGCSTMENLQISIPLWVTFWTNIIWTAGLAVVHQHLLSHYPGHHIVLILPHQTTLCGALSRKKWLHTAITTVKTCTELH